ncbi:outer membrane protein [Helicobacter bizzozeronii]|uniref:OMP536 n=1 Tax=Helicobacter bizzozeronii TaxID=56877 RepID=A0A1M4NII4_HELBI|nr:outer membrane protein [Helicobacter bizzozeronii]SFZ71734.1 OMP536 [Helicobacter bizzozeronii]
MAVKQKLVNTLLPSVVGFFVLLPLNAEKSGVFIGGGFQYSYASGAFKQDTTIQYTIPGFPGSTIKTTNPYRGNLFGGDLQAGFKLFFGQTKRFGLRFYGFFSGQAGNANSVYSGNSDSKFIIKNQPGYNFFYGGGMDMLHNFYGNDERSFGVFVGVMVGWSSWSMGQSQQCIGSTIYSRGGPIGGCVPTNKFFQEQVHINNKYYPGIKSSFSPAFVQVIVNLGFRLNFTKHQGIEMGIRIPTINDLNYASKGAFSEGMIAKIKVNDALILRRDVAAFINYVISF